MVKLSSKCASKILFCFVSRSKNAPEEWKILAPKDGIIIQLPVMAFVLTILQELEANL
jgi:hypothetical protein